MNIVDEMPFLKLVDDETFGIDVSVMSHFSKGGGTLFMVCIVTHNFCFLNKCTKRLLSVMDNKFET